MSATRSTARCHVCWSPHDERIFARVATELKLYIVVDDYVEDSRVTENSPSLRLSDKCYAKQICTVPEEDAYAAMKCVSWQHQPDYPYSFAVGYSNGRVALKRFTVDDMGGVVYVPLQAQALNPRGHRGCTCVSWNTLHPDILAVGFERSRNDSSLLMLDTSVSCDPTSTVLTERHRQISTPLKAISDTPLQMESKIIFDPGVIETVCSLSWIPATLHIAVGMSSSKTIKIYDLNDDLARSRPQMMATHKAVNCLSFDPKFHHRLVSCAENMICMWDTRNFLKPTFTYTLKPNTVISQLEWSPINPNCLAILTNESPYLYLMDIPSAAAGSGDVELLYNDYFQWHSRDRMPYSNKAAGKDVLVSFAWNTVTDNTLMTATGSGDLQLVTAHSKTPLTWGGSDVVAFVGCHGGMCASHHDSPDVAMEMKRRAKLQYGFNPTENLNIVGANQQLRELWSWLELYKRLLKEDKLVSVLGRKSHGSVPGVRSILEGEFSPKRTCSLATVKRMHQHNGVNPAESPDVTMYHSLERDACVLLCGWPSMETEGDLEAFLKREEMEENFERAAAIAVFHGHVRRAVFSLKDGAQLASQQGNGAKCNMLNMISLGMAGYSPSSADLWRDTCASMKKEIKHPYLRAAFSFLCSEDPLHNVLNEAGVSYQDRVAFACHFLDDKKLHSYLTQLSQHLIAGGHIDGLFVTGISHKNGLDLISAYIDMTSDIQTACLVAGQAMPFTPKEKMVTGWFESYGELLDQWRLWHVRASLDIEHKKLDSSHRPFQQSHLTCSYCNKSIGTRPERGGSIGRQFGGDRGQPPTGPKGTVCPNPNCRKPLPRCALCLLNMSISSESRLSDSQSVGNEKFAAWFTWCQTCRHGGHTLHIAEWFREHQECPVSNCNCRCASLDAMTTNVVKE